jgi:amino acid permease
MTSDKLGFFTREALLGGLPARRAGMLLFAIESRTAHLVVEARQAMAHFLSEKTAEARERAFLEALAQGRNLPVQPTIQDLERYAPEWADLVPDQPGIRAVVAQLLGKKYTFTFGDVPALRRTLGLDDSIVQQTYQRNYGQPLDTIYAPLVGGRERLRWAWARIADWLEHLPPFWSVFALTLTETVGASILALPIALAGVGPIVGILLLVVLGLVNMLTIAAISEAIVRNGSFRYGHAFLGRLVADYLGGAASIILAPALFVLLFLALVAFYVGIATSLADASGVPVVVWAALLFLVNIIFLRRKSISATIASALVVGAVNIVLLLALALLALPHVRVERLFYLPALEGLPFGSSTLALIFGVILVSYFGHTATISCARVVLRRDPGGRALIHGNMAAMATALLIYCIWVIAVNGSIAPAELSAQSGTSLPPLAAQSGPIIYLLGSIYAVLGMGMASIHMSLALFNQMREWLPAWPRQDRMPAQYTAGLAGWVQKILTSDRGRFWVALVPVAVNFLLIEWLLLTDQASFTAPLGFLGALIVPLLGGIFPMLLLTASRRKGEYVPQAIVRFLGNPLVVAGVYLLFLGGIFLHGAVIWSDPLLRAAAVLVSLFILIMTAVLVRRGIFAPRMVLELRDDCRPSSQPLIAVTSAGQPAQADIILRFADRERHLALVDGVATPFAGLRSVIVQLPTPMPRELKVWAHRVSPEGLSERLPARLIVHDGVEQREPELGPGGDVVLRLKYASCRVELRLDPASAPEALF